LFTLENIDFNKSAKETLKHLKNLSRVFLSFYDKMCLPWEAQKGLRMTYTGPHHGPDWRGSLRLIKRALRRRSKIS